MVGPADKRKQRGGFAVRIGPHPLAATTLLRIPADPAADLPLKGGVCFLFGGRPVLTPSEDGRVTEDGWLASIPLLLFIWDLVASCARLAQESRSREDVDVISTDYTLAIERLGASVAIRLTKAGVGETRSVAETRLSFREFALAVLETGDLRLTWIETTNPDLKGNLRVRRFRESLINLGHQVSD